MSEIGVGSTETRLVQFVIERICPSSTMEKVVISEPFPIWVEWPPVMRNPFCSAARRYLLAEDSDAIRERVGLPATGHRRSVCDCMGKVIE